MDLAKLIRPKLIRFASHDGLEISGWLYEPPGISGSLPYVLGFHGGPEGQARPSFRSTYQALLAQGIGVFAPNIRGSSGFGKRFVNLVVSSLQERGVPVKYVLFEDEGHGFRKEKNRITSDVESVNWFVHYLKGN